MRYWASTSHLGADTAYSEEGFKIGQKINYQAFLTPKFAAMNFDDLQENAKPSEPSDIWVLSRLNQVVKKATSEFEKFEYARREIIEDFLE